MWFLSGHPHTALIPGLYHPRIYGFQHYSRVDFQGDIVRTAGNQPMRTVWVRPLPSASCGL